VPLSRLFLPAASPPTGHFHRISRNPTVEFDLPFTQLCGEHFLRPENC